MINSIIIGCGKIAGLYDVDTPQNVYSHGMAISNNPGYNLVGCFDLNIEKARKLSKKYNVNHYGNKYIEFIKNNQIDIVTICTPDDTHYDIALKILQNEPVPDVIFIEKPVCLKGEELQDLIKISNERNVVIVVNHSRRFDNKHIEIKKLIDTGYFGKLFRVDVYYYSGWQHNGVHVVDTLNFLFNDKLKINRLNSVFESPYKGDYTAEFELLFEQTKVPVFLHGIDEKYYQLFEFDLKFTKARLRIEDFGERIIYETKYVNEIKENVLKINYLKLDGSFVSPIQNAYATIEQYFITKDNSHLNGVTINKISGTMELLWKGKKWIKELI